MNKQNTVAIYVLCGCIFVLSIGMAALAFRIERRITSENAEIWETLAKLVDNDLDILKQSAHRDSIIAFCMESVIIQLATDKGLLKRQDQIVDRLVNLEWKYVATKMVNP